MTDERHSNHADQERRIREAIRSSGDVRADASFRERLKREFTSGTISEPAAAAPDQTESRGFPRWTWFLFPVAAAAVLLVFLLLPQTSPPAGWTVQAVRGEGQLEIDGQFFSTGDLDRIAQALASGARVKVPAGVALDVRLDDRVILELVEESDVTLPALLDPGSSGLLVSEVRDGELRIKTGPGFPGTEMHILTTEGRTEIVGTIISVYKGDGYTCVCVLEGTALVGKDEVQLEEISPGMLKVMFEDEDEAPIVTGIAGSHKSGLLEFSERVEGAFEAPE